MPVKIYIGRDIQKHDPASGNIQAYEGIHQFCEYLWDIWPHRSPRHYALVVYPKLTKTGRVVHVDLVIISELGLGVIVLSDAYGEIACSQPETAWRAGETILKTDSNGKNFINPHRQVQAYAQIVRDDLTAAHSFPGEQQGHKNVVVHTAVCFIHPDAKIEKCQRAVNVKQWQSIELLPWEKFAVLSYKDVPEWAAYLRFSAGIGEAKGQRPSAWTPEEVDDLAANFFGARLWRGNSEDTAAERPLAYLSVLENGQRVNLFNISQAITTLGRASENKIIIPAEYDTVSRQHAVITRAIDGYVLEDKSQFGTYVNNRPIKEGQKYVLQEGDIILLGGLKEDKRVCCLKFSRKMPPPAAPAADSLDH